MRTESITPSNIGKYLSFFPEEYEKDLFREDLMAIGATFAEEPKGAVLIEEGEKNRLLSIYVSPEARRLGIGTALLLAASKKSLSFRYEATGDRITLEPFLEALDIDYQRYDYPVGVMPLEKALEDLFRAKIDQLQPQGALYEDLSREGKKCALKWLQDVCAEEAYLYTQKDSPSIFLMNEEKVQGALLLSMQEEGLLSVDYVYCMKGSNTLLGGMLCKEMELLRKSFPKETELSMAMTTKAGEELYEKLFGDPVGTVAMISGNVDAFLGQSRISF